MSCEIDYCSKPGSKVLTVETDDEIITLTFCTDHALALKERLADQLNLPRHALSLQLMPHGGTIGELNEAISYLDNLAVSRHVVAH